MSSTNAQFNVYHLHNVNININSFNTTTTRVANAMNRNTTNFGKSFIFFILFNADDASASSNTVR